MTFIDQIIYIFHEWHLRSVWSQAQESYSDVSEVLDEILKVPTSTYGIERHLLIAHKNPTMKCDLVANHHRFEASIVSCTRVKAGELSDRKSGGGNNSVNWEPEDEEMSEVEAEIADAGGPSEISDAPIFSNGE